MTYAYAVSNRLTGLSASAFSWSTAYANTAAEEAAVNDARLAPLNPSNAAASASPIDFQIDMGSAVNIAGFAILNHTLWSGAGWTAPRITIQAADDSGFSVNLTTPKAASTVPQYTNKRLTRDTALMTSGNTSARYWRIRFDETSGTPNRLVSIGEVFALTNAAPYAATTLARFPIYGEGETAEYVTSESLISTGDVTRALRGGPIITKRFAFADLSSSQRDELLLMWHATRGGVSNLLWMPNYNGTSAAASAAEQECLYGRLQPTLGWAQADFDIYDVDGFELRGRGREIGF